MQEYSNEKITVRYDEKVCIHAGKCVRGLPQVFDVEKNPWINVNGADVEAIKRTIAQCPSGALSYEERK
ncbi:MAG TPA: (4Fe-4S)-binding protein [Candidatus Binatia bacterium]|nr:(4Fe-4S)-binding protein [Candidatus Binatia bacterium]